MRIGHVEVINAQVLVPCIQCYFVVNLTNDIPKGCFLFCLGFQQGSLLRRGKLLLRQTNLLLKSCN